MSTQSESENSAKNEKKKKKQQSNKQNNEGFSFYAIAWDPRLAFSQSATTRSGLAFGLLAGPATKQRPNKSMVKVSC